MKRGLAIAVTVGVAVSVAGCRSHRSESMTAASSSVTARTEVSSLRMVDSIAAAEDLAIEIDSVVRVGADSSVTVTRGVRARLMRSSGEKRVEESDRLSRHEESVSDSVATALKRDRSDGAPGVYGLRLILAAGVICFLLGRWSRAR